MNVLSTPLGREADDRSMQVIAEIAEKAGEDDRLLLRLLAENAVVTRQHKERLEAARDAAAARLRDAGVPMIAIADDAGVTDSYLARRVIKKGAARRNDRTKTQSKVYRRRTT